MHSVFSVFFFTCSPSLILQLLAPSVLEYSGVSTCSGYSLPNLSVSLPLICCLGVLVPPAALYCLLHLVLFLSSGLSHRAFSYPDFSSLVFTLFSAFYEPIIQHHTCPLNFCLLSFYQLFWSSCFVYSILLLQLANCKLYRQANFCHRLLFAHTAKLCGLFLP